MLFSMVPMSASAQNEETQAGSSSNAAQATAAQDVGTGQAVSAAEDTGTGAEESASASNATAAEGAAASQATASASTSNAGESASSQAAGEEPQAPNATSSENALTSAGAYNPSSDCTVAFNAMGGSDVASQTVVSGGSATKPGDPTKSGFIFDGWYTSNDEGATLSDTAYDFTTAVTSNLTLYAKWTAATYGLSMTPVNYFIFDEATYGSAKTQTQSVTVTNTGNQTIYLNPETTSFNTVLSFSGVPASGTTLAPGDKISFSVNSAVGPTNKAKIYLAGALVEGYATSDMEGMPSATVSLVVFQAVDLKDISTLDISGIGNYVYTGSACKPEPIITDNTTTPSKTLVAGTDYTYTYETALTGEAVTDPTDVGTYNVVITGTGNYKGTIRKTFSITALVVGAPTYKPSLTYNGAEQTSIVPGTYYTVTGGSGTDAGSYTAVAALKDKTNTVWANNSTEDITYSWKIVPKDASAATVDAIADQTYTGSAITPDVRVVLDKATLVKDKDYTIAFADNTNSGTAKYTIAFINNYASAEPLTGTFTIKPKGEADFSDGTGSGIAQTGLDKVLENAIAGNKNAKSIIINLDLSASSGAGAAAIKAAAAAAGLTFDTFYDAVLTQTVDGAKTDIGSGNDVLIGITYPFDFSGKTTVRVFAYHAGSVYELTATPNADGEYIVTDAAAGTVTVYAKRYSTYGIGYTTSASTSTSTSTATDKSGKTTAGTKTSTTAKTGDAAMPSTILLLTLIAAAGAAIVVGAVAYRRRRSTKGEHTKK